MIFIGIVCVIICVTFIACTFAMYNIFSNADKNTSSTTEEGHEQLQLGIELDSQKRAKYMEMLDSALSDIENENIYTAFFEDNGATSISAVTNKNGEAVYQTSDTGEIKIYRNDGKMIPINTETGEIGEIVDSLDIINLMREVYNKAISQDATVLQLNEVYIKPEYTGILVCFDGIDNSAELYSSLGDAYVDAVAEEFENTVAENNAKDLSIIYQFVINTDESNQETYGKLEGIVCYLYLGEESPEKIKTNTSGLTENWYMPSFITIDDWELSEKMYDEATTNEEMLSIFEQTFENISNLIVNSVNNLDEVDVGIEESIEDNSLIDESNLEQNGDSNSDMNDDIEN